MNRISTLFVLAIALFLASCVESNNNSQVVQVTDNNEGELIKIEGKIFSLPSPVQAAILLRNANSKYNENLLHPSSKSKTYTSNFKKAINLGIYGSDLAYLTNFNSSTKSAEYFKTVEEIASDMGITSSMDPALLKRFYDNLNNRDSLYALNSEFFRVANAYLKDVNQEEQAALILTGGWLEALHLCIDAAETDKTVRRRVGEQKASLTSLIELLSLSTEPSTIELKTDLEGLDTAYESITSEYTYVQPIPDPQNKTTHIRSKSMVEVSDEQLKALKEVVTTIRTKVTA